MALVSHWRRHPANFGALFAGLAIATALWSGVQALNEQARKSYDQAASMFATGARSLVPTQGAFISQDIFVKLRLAGWNVSPVLEGAVRVGDTPFRLLGVEPLTLPRESGLPSLSGGSSLIDFLAPPGRTIVAPKTLRDLRAARGAALPVEGGLRLPPLQARANAPPGLLVVDIGVAQALLKRPGQISRLVFTQQPGAATPSLASITSNALRVLQPGEEASDLKRLTASFHLNLTAFGMLAFLVGLFIVHASFGLAFEQRRAMVRTLRAVGVGAPALVLAMLMELLLLALAAGTIGAIGGAFIAAALLPDVASSLDALYGAQVAGRLALDPQWWISGLGIALIGALVAAASGLARTLRLPVLVAARPSAWRQAQQKFLRRRAVLAGLGLAASLVAYVFGGSLASGFAVVAGLLLGAALLLPLLLASALRLGERRATGPLAQWFWADSRQQLPALSLALMALLLALSTNVGVGGMVEGFRTTFTRWLDARLVAEVYFEAAGAPEARAIETWLAGRPGVTAILPVLKTSVRLAGWPVEVIGMKPHETYRKHFPLLSATPGAWDEVERGDGFFVSEQLARRLRLAPGSSLDIPTPEGAWRAKVAGVFPDYGNPKGQARIGFDALERHWPGTPRLAYSLRVKPAAVDGLIAAMQAQFGPKITRISDQASIKRLSMRIFERTFAVTAALNGLMLIVSAVALFASLLTLGNARLAQIAPVWAAGATRGRLAQLEFLRLLSLTAATALVALPLGLALSWCLVAVVNVQAFGWRLPFHVFPGQWAQILVLALLAATVAGAAPILRLARTTASDLLKVFASER